MNTRLLLALAGAAVGVLTAAGPAHAVDRPRPQAECAQVGATTTITTKDGPQQYRCEQRKDDDCPRWHWIYNPGVPKGQHTPRPGQPCANCGTTTPPATATVTPAARPTSHASKDELPVTGPNPWLLVTAGLLSLGAGGALLRAGRQRTTA